jgi:hypothetical protein
MRAVQPWWPSHTPGRVKPLMSGEILDLKGGLAGKNFPLLGSQVDCWEVDPL